MLPIAPFTETSGTFVNTEGRAQSFNGVVRPLGDTRPGWKVLRVLGNLLGIADFEFDTSEAVRDTVLAGDIAGKLDNATDVSVQKTAAYACRHRQDWCESRMCRSMLPTPWCAMRESLQQTDRRGDAASAWMHGVGIAVLGCGCRRPSQVEAGQCGGGCCSPQQRDDTPAGRIACASPGGASSYGDCRSAVGVRCSVQLRV